MRTEACPWQSAFSTWAGSTRRSRRFVLFVTGRPRCRAGTVALYAGRSLYRLGRLDEAAAQLKDAAASLAAERSPMGADASYWRGWALLRLRRPAEAYGSFLAVAEGYPDDPRRLESLFRGAVCETMQGNDASAVTLYEEVMAEPRPAAADGSAPAPAIVEQAMYERAQALSRLGRGRGRRGCPGAAGTGVPVGTACGAGLLLAGREGAGGRRLRGCPCRVRARGARVPGQPAGGPGSVLGGRVPSPRGRCAGRAG